MTSGRWKNSRTKETKKKRIKARVDWAENRLDQKRRSKIQKEKYK